MTSLAQMLKMGESYSHEKCPINGCTNFRQGITKYCRAHHVRKTRYGDPHGRPISRSEYMVELKQVRDFFELYSSHPALASANHYFQNWLDKAKNNEAAVGQSIFGKLFREGIEPQAILTEVMAIWLYSDRHPNALPDDLRLTYCLARNVARLGTLPQTRTKSGKVRSHDPKPMELRGTGELIRHSMARFYLNLAHALKAKAEEEVAIRQNLSMPFTQ